MVVASRIHDCVGPRENAGPKWTFFWAVDVEMRESRLRAVESCILESFAGYRLDDVKKDDKPTIFTNGGLFLCSCFYLITTMFLISEDWCFVPPIKEVSMHECFISLWTFLAW